MKQFFDSFVTYFADSNSTILINIIFEVHFTDMTEIILSSENRLVTYVNKAGERSDYPLVTVQDSDNIEMKKRLKYTNELLMLNGENIKNQQVQQLKGNN